jgi:hypothetical protein
MANLIILGHGGFTKGGFETLVPPNTTIRFFADAGSPLSLPAKRVGGELVFDYAQVADILANYKETESPLQPGAVVYNMLLGPVDPEEQRIAKELDAAGKWGGEIMLTPTGGMWKLCNGDPSTCPTPKLNVARGRHDELLALGDAAVNAFQQWLTAGASGELPEELSEFKPRLVDVLPEHYQYVADGVPAEKWTHSCGGLLDLGTGKDIYWIACSGFVANQASLDSIGLSEGLPSEMTAQSNLKDWAPEDDDFARISAFNQQKVKDTPDGGSISLAAGGVMLLIGAGHEANAANYVKRQDDLTEGTLTVKKGGAFSKGGITITGIAPAKQRMVKDAIEEFSDKKVTFE